VALNQEEELEEEAEQETVEKDDIIVDAGDKISIEEEKKDEPSTIDFSAIPPVSYQQEHRLNEKTDHSLEKYSSCQEPVDENREVALEKASQLIISDKMVITEVPANTHDNEMDKGMLHFEFSMHYNEMQNHMDLLFGSKGNDGKVWFNVKIDIKTGEVISKNFGRIYQQQQGES
jgi:hypothetical protein